MAIVIKHKYYDSTTLFMCSAFIFLAALFYFENVVIAFLLLVLAVVISISLHKLHCTITEDKIEIRKNLLGIGNRIILFNTVEKVRIYQPYRSGGSVPWIYVTAHMKGSKKVKAAIPISTVSHLAKFLYLLDKHSIEYTIQSGPFKNYDHEFAHHMEWEKEEFKKTQL